MKGKEKKPYLKTHLGDFPGGPVAKTHTLTAGSPGSDATAKVQFSRSVVSDSLQPHGLHHARPPCPLPAPRVYSDSCPLSW